MGLLTITGTADFSQLWPGKKADSDTLHVAVRPGSFRYQERPGGPSKVTHVFVGARLRGGGASKPVIARDNNHDGNGTITIRLEGIDAPELHYRPQALPRTATTAQRQAFKAVNKEYRQLWAETSVKRLRAALGPDEDKIRPCRVVTKVDHPNDVCDVYARVVGEVQVRRAGRFESLNRLMVRQGVVFPAFYNSMDPDDLDEFLNLWQEGRKVAHGIARRFARTIPAFDPALQYRDDDAGFTEAGDRGPVLFPKLYRRQCTWFGQQRAGFFNGDFHAFIQASSDDCHLTQEFLTQGATAAPVRFLRDFVTAQGRVTFRPETLIFRERASTLLDAAGHPVAHW